MYVLVHKLTIILTAIHIHYIHFKFQFTGMAHWLKKNSTRSICPPAVKNTRTLKLHSIKLLRIMKLPASKEFKIKKFMNCIMWNAKQWWKNLAVTLQAKNWCSFMALPMQILRKLMLVDWTEVSQENMVRFKIIYSDIPCTTVNCKTTIARFLSLQDIWSVFHLMISRNCLLLWW